MLFQCKFVGRKIGADGVRYPITVEVAASSRAKVLDQLYKRYEHINELKIERSERDETRY